MKNEHTYTIFYIIRHGETEANVKKILQGHSDYPLTQRGKDQAKEVSGLLKNIHFDKVFSSDLFRAKHTAQLILLERKMAIETSKLLRERTFGKYEGTSWFYQDDHLKKMWQKYETLSDQERFRFKFSEDQESDEEIATRMLTFIREIAVAYPGKTILIVSHGGIMRATLIKLGVSSYATIPPGAVKNLGFFKLESDGVDFFLKETHNIDLQKKA